MDDQLEAYAALHPKDDYIMGFFNVVMVCEGSFEMCITIS